MAKKNIKTHSKKKKAKVLIKQKRYAAAREIYQKVCEVDKRDADAWYMLGVANYILVDNDRSIDNLKHAIQLRPRHALSYYYLGLAYRVAKRLEDAITAFSKSIAIDVDNIDAHQLFIQTLTDVKKYDQAIDVLRGLIQRMPANAEYRSNLGSLLQTIGELDGAIDSYQQALRLNPRLTIAWDSLGSAFLGSRRYEEAIDAFHQSLKVEPTNARGHSNLLLTLNYMENLTPQQVYEEHRIWGEKHGNKSIKHISLTAVEGRPVRVAYISPDFREHSVAYFIEPLLEAHNKDKFQIYCYSSTCNGDETTNRIRSLTAFWRDICNQPAEVAAAQIRQDNIDILVDLSGHTASNHLKVFAEKPAPIQVTWLGYPNTTGLQAVDYRIVDNITDPEGYEVFCTEELIRIPGCFICFKPPELRVDVGELPYEKNGYITFGSFNNLSKISNDVLDTWAELLLRVPQSRLMLKNRSLANEATRAELQQYFENRGVVTERVILMAATSSKFDHFSLYNRIDIALDTYPYNGTTTTCEALWMGVPVITILGDSHAARVSASLLKNIGLDDLVAKDKQEYISIASSLAANSRYLFELRPMLRQQVSNSSLGMQSQFAENIETAYLEMCKQKSLC